MYTNQAPVPVLLHETEWAVLGGAANVCANIAAVGGEVAAIGVIGRDEAGFLLTDLLAGYPTVNAQWLFTDLHRPTTRRIRVMSGVQQMVRIDSGSKMDIPSKTEEEITSAIRDGLRWADVAVVSDYEKGLCNDRIIRMVIEMAAEAGKASIIDPKRRDFSIYRDATLIKPNRRELTDATGLPCETYQQAETAALAAIAQTNSAILLTRSEHGMSYFERNKKPLHLKTAAQDVFDVWVELAAIDAHGAPEVAADLKRGLDDRVPAEAGRDRLEKGEFPGRVAADHSVPADRHARGLDRKAAGVALLRGGRIHLDDVRDGV